MPESAAAEDRAESAADAPAEHWRAPAVLGLKSLAGAAAGIAIAAVFFPLWVAVPVAVVLAVWSVGLCVRRPAVTLDGPRGVLTVRLGAVTRRVPLAAVEAVVLDRGRILIGKSDQTALSFYAWRHSKLDSWLRVPDISGDLAHAISRAATAAAAGNVTGTPVPPGRRRRRGSPLAALACAGAAEIAAAILTRVSWGSPAMTAAGVIVALAFGFTGTGTLVFALWTFLTSRAGTPRRTGA